LPDTERRVLSVSQRLGHGDWAIVDSCLSSTSRQPIAIEYLKHLGVNPATAVRLVVASHFHDDHIRGLNAIVEVSPNAKFVCSAALGVDEFFQLVEANSQVGTRESTTQEFDGVLNLLDARARLHARAVGPDYGLHGTILFERAGLVDSQVRAVSPSSTTVTAAHLRLASLLPSVASAKKPIADIGANELSLAIWLRVGKVSAILAADLERGRPGEGWQAVVESAVRPLGEAAVFKVAHHGSPNARHEDVWTKMLELAPVAVVTAYARGVRKRPAKADLDWLQERTSRLYVTSLGLSRSPRAHNRHRHGTCASTNQCAIRNGCDGDFRCGLCGRLIARVPDVAWLSDWLSITKPTTARLSDLRESLGNSGAGDPT
jgi:beta-lactamase superfamily II metal-dependent hydrolase